MSDNICSKCGCDVLEENLDITLTPEQIEKFRDTINAFWNQEVTLDYAYALAKFIKEYALRGGIDGTN